MLLPIVLVTFGLRFDILDDVFLLHEWTLGSQCIDGLSLSRCIKLATISFQLSRLMQKPLNLFQALRIGCRHHSPIIQSASLSIAIANRKRLLFLCVVVGIES